MLPTWMLKKMIMGKSALELPTQDENIKRSLEFMEERLDSLPQPELASRLTLNCIDSCVEPQKLQGIPVTIIDVSVHLISKRLFTKLK